VLDKLPKKEQPTAKQLLRSINYADTQNACEKLRDRFVSRHRKEYSEGDGYSDEGLGLHGDASTASQENIGSICAQPTSLISV
jgi:hypothetical protein